MEVELDRHVVRELYCSNFAGSCSGFDDFNEVAKAIGGFCGFLSLNVQERVATFLKDYCGAHEITGCGEGELFCVCFDPNMVADDLSVFYSLT